MNSLLGSRMSCMISWRLVSWILDGIRSQGSISRERVRIRMRCGRIISGRGSRMSCSLLRRSLARVVPRIFLVYFVILFDLISMSVGACNEGAAARMPLLSILVILNASVSSSSPWMASALDRKKSSNCTPGLRSFPEPLWGRLEFKLKAALSNLKIHSEYRTRGILSTLEIASKMTDAGAGLG